MQDLDEMTNETVDMIFDSTSEEDKKVANEQIKTSHQIMPGKIITEDQNENEESKLVENHNKEEDQLHQS